MKKIEFGFANEEYPRGSWQGIGIREGMMLTSADYYGAFSFNKENYILAKVVEDEFQRYPQLLGNFIVRKALCDLYADGSVVLMLNQNEDMTTKNLEIKLNNPQIKEKIHSIDDVCRLCNGVWKSSPVFILAEQGETVIATSITDEAFNARNDNLKKCRRSVAAIQAENIALYEENKELQYEIEKLRRKYGELDYPNPSIPGGR